MSAWFRVRAIKPVSGVSVYSLRKRPINVGRCADAGVAHALLNDFQGDASRPHVITPQSDATDEGQVVEACGLLRGPVDAST